MFRPFTSTGRDQASWPVLSLLLLVVLVPTLGVLWFMDQAMRNERLAVRQKLSEVYRASLSDARDALEARWRLRLLQLEVDRDLPAGARFARAIRSGSVESLLLYDEAGGVLYPQPTLPAQASPPSGPWRRARRLEQSGALLDAVDAYDAIAVGAEASQAARAIQSAARALQRAGQTDAAIGRLLDGFG
ncbi:MAG: hypothetical protein AAGM22_29060, partial [Acidobacteriota bacterium]